MSTSVNLSEVSQLFAAGMRGVFCEPEMVVDGGKTVVAAVIPSSSYLEFVYDSRIGIMLLVDTVMWSTDFSISWMLGSRKFEEILRGTELRLPPKDGMPQAFTLRRVLPLITEPSVLVNGLSLLHNFVGVLCLDDVRVADIVQDPAVFMGMQIEALKYRKQILGWNHG